VGSGFLGHRPPFYAPQRVGGLPTMWLCKSR